MVSEFYCTYYIEFDCLAIFTIHLYINDKSSMLSTIYKLNAENQSHILVAKLIN